MFSILPDEGERNRNGPTISAKQLIGNMLNQLKISVDIPYVVFQIMASENLYKAFHENAVLSSHIRKHVLYKRCNECYTAIIRKIGEFFNGLQKVWQMLILCQTDISLPCSREGKVKYTEEHLQDNIEDGT
ncbi:Hypothetical predicted protein [Octopus vulgaris]|uniref:Uncharacterized protein n=1 Tax=Octopus vulgaris TaxID=6645 RepID=A0AA36B9H5_OCTVU|nr:Hypothetical predicted protein [Octopus vulgaris]